jgi:hypothetical protein
MQLDTGYTMHYLVSTLLPSNSYEAELKGQILDAMRKSPSASEFTSPAILPGPPNRTYFIDRFLSELARVPFAVEIISPEQEVEQQIDGYEKGRRSRSPYKPTLRSAKYTFCGGAMKCHKCGEKFPVNLAVSCSFGTLLRSVLRYLSGSRLWLRSLIAETRAAQSVMPRPK